MSTRYEVRQQVSTVRRSWLDVVYESPYERLARSEYDQLISDNPGAYFELVCVESGEKCLAWRQPSHAVSVDKPAGSSQEQSGES